MSRNLTDHIIESMRRMCLMERNLLFFASLFYRELTGDKLLKNWHHYYFSMLAKDVYDGKIKRLLINVAPGSSKTLFFSQCFIALGFAINAQSKFIQASYSDDLVLDNSKVIKDIINSELYQILFPEVRIRVGTNQAKLWKTSKNGGLRVASTGGAITGFRAGVLTQKDRFSGAIILDDPNKPDDIYSKAKTAATNRRITDTIDSRLAHSDVPIIIIQQRLSVDDATAYVIEKYSADSWTQITIPALVNDDYLNGLPELVAAKSKFNSAINSLYRDHLDRFSYWHDKEQLGKLLELEQFNGFMFAAQYQQTPRLLNGNLIKTNWYDFYDELPKLKHRGVYADTAQKDKESSDYTVLIHAGIGYDDKLYIIEVLRGKWRSVELERNAVTFWNKAKAFDNKEFGVLRHFAVEDKSSGTDLIDRLHRLYKIPIKAVPKNKDKYQTFMDCQTYLENRLVRLPHQAVWLIDFISESEIFDGKPSTDKKKDDQVDAMFIAIILLLVDNRPSVWDDIG